MIPERSRLLSAAAAAALLGVFALPGVARADYIRDREWWLGPMRIAEAQKETRGQGVVVGVIDTPIDASRPELKGRVLDGKGHNAGDPSNGIDDSAAGSHGTSMAGLIAGESPKRGGYLGVAPEARILPYATNNTRTPNLVASGVRWLTDKGVKVINMSLGGVGTASSAEVEAVNYAISRDVVVVVSAGNSDDGTNAVQVPANIPGVVAVSGVDKAGAFWPKSSFGPEVVLSAPAYDLPVVVPLKVDKTGYLSGDGTSEAAAIVSGVAALVRSKYPDMNAANVIERLIRTAKDNGPDGRDDRFGFGVVRPVQALNDKVPTVDKSSLGSTGGDTTGGGSTVKPGTGKPVKPPVDALPSTPKGSSSNVPVIAGVGVGLLIIVALVVVLVMRRGRRRPALSGHGGQAAGWPGSAPGQYGPGSQQGYPPPPGPQQGYPGRYGQQAPPPPGQQAPPAGYPPPHHHPGNGPR